MKDMCHLLAAIATSVEARAGKSRIVATLIYMPALTTTQIAVQGSKIVVILSSVASWWIGPGKHCYQQIIIPFTRYPVRKVMIITVDVTDAHSRALDSFLVINDVCSYDEGLENIEDV